MCAHVYAIAICSHMYVYSPYYATPDFKVRAKIPSYPTFLLTLYPNVEQDPRSGVPFDTVLKCEVPGISRGI